MKTKKEATKQANAHGTIDSSDSVASLRRPRGDLGFKEAALRHGGLCGGRERLPWCAVLKGRPQPSTAWRTSIAKQPCRAALAAAGLFVGGRIGWDGNGTGAGPVPFFWLV